GNATTVRHRRPPVPARGIRTLKAHQEDLLTSRTDTQNDLLCRDEGCDRRTAGPPCQPNPSNAAAVQIINSALRPVARSPQKASATALTPSPGCVMQSPPARRCGP